MCSRVAFQRAPPQWYGPPTPYLVPCVCHLLPRSAACTWNSAYLCPKTSKTPWHEGKWKSSKNIQCFEEKGMRGRILTVLKKSRHKHFWPPSFKGIFCFGALPPHTTQKQKNTLGEACQKGESKKGLQKTILASERLSGKCGIVCQHILDFGPKYMD